MLAKFFHSSIDSMLLMLVESSERFMPNGFLLKEVLQMVGRKP